jgi:hypothetical protein
MSVGSVQWLPSATHPVRVFVIRTLVDGLPSCPLPSQKLSGLLMITPKVKPIFLEGIMPMTLLNELGVLRAGWELA